MENVLFLGNSHTFVENLPWVFAEVCAQAGKKVHATMITHPGCDLRWHIDWMCVMPNIKHGGYKYVVLQQRSHPFDGAEALIAQASVLHEAITESGAVTVLSQTWSEKRNPEGQRIITDAFSKLHDKASGSLLAQCGEAWHKLRDKVDLYAKDGEHQNAKGAYLNACILAKTMFGIDPTSLEEAIFINGKQLEISVEDIRLLQQTANTNSN